MTKHPEKPIVHYGVPEWCNNNEQLSATAELERYLSNVIRQESRTLRNDTNCKTNWDESDTSRMLRDRVWEVSRCKDLLVSCAKKVDDEIEALTLSKTRTEETLAATAVPHEVSMESLTLREGRQGFELINDPVEKELKKEVHVIERAQQTLQQLIDQAFEQLWYDERPRLWEKIRQQLTADLQNKVETLDIDNTCLELTITSSQISLKPDPTRIPAGSCTPHEWIQFTQLNLARAREAMEMSEQMREDMSLTRVSVPPRDERRRAQHNEAHCTWFTILFKLDADLKAKTAPLKLAHTRLENRTCRPGMDLCRDEVDVERISINKSLHSLQRLKLHHNQMKQDHARKRGALALEERCINIRNRLIPILYSDGTPVPLLLLTSSSGRSTRHLEA
uniref:Tektin n=1 Tax=Hippocampus comes TaxID=109280 RepID=A0A3Q2XWA6_HIPCM